MLTAFDEAVAKDGFAAKCYSARGRQVHRKAEEIDGERLYAILETGQLTLDGVPEPLDVLVVTGSAGRRGCSPAALVAVALEEIRKSDDQSEEITAAAGALVIALQKMQARERMTTPATTDSPAA